MTRPTATSSERIAFDRSEPLTIPTERRYPLDLSVRLPELRSAYYESNAAIWDVEKDFAAQDHGIDHLEADACTAAAVVWSRRAWLEFAGIAESEAALVRSCIELEREADIKFVLATRATEHAVAADASHRLAERFGGYTASPSTPELSQLFTSESIRRALDERVSFDAFFIAHFVVLAAVEQALLVAAAESCTDPMCASTLARILVSVERQQSAGVLYARVRLPNLTDAETQAVTQNVAAVVDIDIRSGVRCSAFLDPDLAGAAALIEAESRAAAAGLGAASPADQRAAVEKALESLDSEALPAGADARDWAL